MFAFVKSSLGFNWREREKGKRSRWRGAGVEENMFMIEGELSGSPKERL